MTSLPVIMRGAARLAAVAIAATVATVATVASAAAQRSSVPPSPSPSSAAPSPRATPTLVLLLTIDQMRSDYLPRFASQLEGGLARLHRGGAVFTRAYQDHAITETAPGHASTLSGRFPRSTGIVTNSTGVEDSQAPLIGSTGPGASPYRFRGSTLTDWLRSRDPRTRALSVSRKDRGAILPLGHAKQSVFWYDPAYAAPGGSVGGFTTSRYYADTLPSWVTGFNARNPVSRFAGATWWPLLSPASYAEPDSVRAENEGASYVFPHVLPSDPGRLADELRSAPTMDSLTLALALDGLRALDLGRGPQTDVLAVSLSTTDAVGHRFGPDSRELHDQILRLDRYLGAFFDSLHAARDSSRIVVVLTSDHGVGPYPNVRSADPNAGARFIDPGKLMAPVRASLAARGADSGAVVLANGIVQLDRPALARARLNADSLVRALAATLRATPGIMRAETMRQVASRDTTTDAVARRWMHMIPPDLDVALVVTPRPYWEWGSGEWPMATHGIPHDHDAHVPLIFYGPPFAAGRYTRYSRVVDIAPTLAAVLGVPPTERLDGRVLREALRK